MALTEAAIRVAKQTVRTLMRKAMASMQMANEEPYTRVIVDYFNLLFGATRYSVSYWNGEMREGLERCFFYLNASPLQELRNLKEHVSLAHMFKQLTSRLGLQFKSDLLPYIEDEAMFRQSTLLRSSDAITFSPVVREMDARSKAFHLYQQVRSLPIATCCNSLTPPHLRPFPCGPAVSESNSFSKRSGSFGRAFSKAQL